LLESNFIGHLTLLACAEPRPVAIVVTNDEEQRGGVEKKDRDKLYYSPLISVGEESLSRIVAKFLNVSNRVYVLRCIKTSDKEVFALQAMVCKTCETLLDFLFERLERQRALVKSKSPARSTRQ
jgi:hypothetical protein